MDVPFNRLTEPDAQTRLALVARLSAVVERGWYLSGPEVEGFEREFSAWLGLAADRVIGVGNGTDALELALAALQLPAGAEVLTVANAGGYASTALRLRGLVPRYVDVDETSGRIDPASLQAALDHAPAAVVLTHLYGRPVDVDTVLRPVVERGIPVIEDCAQAHGARTVAGPVGTLGTLATFSFYPTKNLGALGDAGAVATSDATLADRVRRLAQYGWHDKYRVGTAGGRNSRMDELQAAVLRLRLPALEAANRRRGEIAARYRAGLANPLVEPDAAVDGEVNHLFTVRCTTRDALAGWLRQNGVGSAVHYPVPDHRQPAWADDFRGLALPVTERRAERLLSLPCHPLLSDQDIDHVIRTCNDFRP